MEIPDEIKINLKISTTYGIIGRNIKDLLADIRSNYSNKKVYLLIDTLVSNIYYPTLYERMKYEIKRRNLIIKDIDKKIIDSLKIVGLKKDLLARNINTLSSSEKVRINLALCLIANPDIIIISNPLKEYDKKTEKKIVLLLQKIKEQYNKIILFISDDCNILYQYTNNIILYENNKIILNKNTENFFQDIEMLKQYHIPIPDIVEITYLAKQKKNIKLDYHKDIRDIIKDIYKHV